VVRLASKFVVGMFYVGPIFFTEVLSPETLMEEHKPPHNQDWGRTRDTEEEEVVLYLKNDIVRIVSPGYTDYLQQIIPHFEDFVWCRMPTQE
jgi:hypothetical protein